MSVEEEEGGAGAGKRSDWERREEGGERTEMEVRDGGERGEEVEAIRGGEIARRGGEEGNNEGIVEAVGSPGPGCSRYNEAGLSLGEALDLDRGRPIVGGEVGPGRGSNGGETAPGRSKNGDISSEPPLVRRGCNPGAIVSSKSS